MNDREAWEPAENEELDVQHIEEHMASRAVHDVVSIGYDEEDVPQAIVDDPTSLYMREISQYDLLTREEEYELFGKFNAGDLAAKEKLLQSNLRWVVKIAKQYMGRPHDMSLLDLIQEGNLGLLRAIDKFEREKGFRLTTYSTAWIRQRITRAIEERGGTIRVSVGEAGKVSRMARSSSALEQELGRAPTNEEIAIQLGVTVQKVIDMKQTKSRQTVLSLDTPVRNDGDATLGDLIEDQSSDDPEDVAANEVLKAALAPLLDELTDQERSVIEKRFGLDGQGGQTLAQIGEEYGFSRQYISQTEKRALAKLRNLKGISSLRDYVG